MDTDLELKRRYRREYQRRYNKTRVGLLFRRYHSMRWRVEGLLYKQNGSGKNHIGLPLLEYQEFKKWALADSAYNCLYDRWKDRGFPDDLSPSIDRIDNSKGYEIGNMQWITFWQNSQKGKFETTSGKSKYRGVHHTGKRKKISRVGEWAAVGYNNGSACKIGTFQTELEAAIAYDEWSLEVRGFKVNFRDKPIPVPEEKCPANNSVKNVTSQDWSEDSAFNQVNRGDEW